ncbi:MAG: zinc-dependent metalloprotease, partial [Fimbriimonadaceae bacterium]|nr:zinc-dependent metalloprotease [Fimbriimonadaceae bacterium]
EPFAPMSEPVEPIVFWVDNAWPEEFRPTVRDGILSWNKAFEQIGYKNAIVVKQMPDDADFDHADMRYNVIRLVTSPSAAYAVAHFRVNPLTGQILNASVTVDSNFLKFSAQEFEVFRPEVVFRERRALIDGDQETIARKLAKAKAQEHRHTAACGCEVQRTGALKAAFGDLAVALADMPSEVADKRRDEYRKAMLLHVVQHEFGHILGLRHNFVASTQLTLAQMADPQTVKDKNITASVMDYVSFNPMALKNSQVPFMGADLGDYDYWAIRYGYLDTGIRDSVREQNVLRAVAALNTRPGLAYQSDEQADGLDPFTVRFDLSAQPLDYAEEMAKTSRRLLLSLGTRMPERGESFFEFSRGFNILMNMYSRATADATTFVGGYRRNFSFKGDGNPRSPIKPVSAADQRRAVRIVTDYVLKDSALDLPKSYFKRFAPDPNAGFTAHFIAALNDYPIFDQMADFQASALSALLNGGTLSRLQNQAWKAEKGEDAMTPREVMEKVTSAVWSGADSAPISDLRRQLQRTHVDRLIELGVRQLNSRSEINVLAWGQLKAVRARVGQMKPTDPDSRLHLTELGARIDRAMNAIETLGGSGGGGGGFNILDLLGRRP